METEEEEIWPTINDTFIEEYSNFFNNGIQIAIIILAASLFIIIFLIYAFIRCFDKSTKLPSPTQYSIRFDPKGFSSNELRLYNVKSVEGGCRLKSIVPIEKGKAGILHAERMFDPPILPRFDTLLQPWITEIPVSQIFYIVEWNDFFDNPAENSDLPGTGESVAAPIAEAPIVAAAAPAAAPPPSNNNVEVSKKAKEPDIIMPKTSVKESGATPKTPAKDSDTTPKRPAPKTPSIKSVKQIQITIPTPTPAPTPTPTRTEKTQATTPPNAGATPMSADGESNIKKNSRRSPDSFKSIK